MGAYILRPHVCIGDTRLSRRFFSGIIYRPIGDARIRFTCVTVFGLIICILYLFGCIGTFRRRHFGIFFVRTRLTIVFARGVFVTVLVYKGVLYTLGVCQRYITKNRVDGTFFKGRGIHNLFKRRCVSTSCSIMPSEDQVVNGIYGRLFNCS